MNTLSPDMFKQDWLGQTLGIEFTETTPERIVATMPITPAHHQPFGFLHGGASVALAESVASFGGMANAPTGKMVVGLEINANHLRTRRDGLLTAVGTPLHIGRTTQVWEIRISDENGKLICVSRCTLAVVSRERGA